MGALVMLAVLTLCIISGALLASGIIRTLRRSQRHF